MSDNKSIDCKSVNCNEKTNIEIGNIIDILKKHKQIILIGPSGVGKTFLADKVASIMANQKKEQMKIVQFHSSYSYEDFVIATSVTTKNGKVNYNIEPKIFLKFIREAQKSKEKDENKEYVFIIDDIDRANISAVFGELLYALENRNEKVTLLYEANKEPLNETICIPDNVYIIATMNTAVKKNFSMDYAMRRRFFFYQVKSDIKMIEVEDNEVYKEITEKYEKAERLFETINNKEEYMIGHGFFKANSPDELNLRVRYQVIPMLQQYVKDGILRVDNKDIEGLSDKLPNYSLECPDNDYEIIIKKQDKDEEKKSYRDDIKDYMKNIKDQKNPQVLLIQLIINQILKKKLISNYEIFNRIMRNKKIVEVIVESGKKLTFFATEEESYSMKGGKPSHKNNKSDGYNYKYSVNNKDYYVFRAYTLKNKPCSLSLRNTKGTKGSVNPFLLAYRTIYYFYDVYRNNIDKFIKEHLENQLYKLEIKELKIIKDQVEKEIKYIKSFENKKTETKFIWEEANEFKNELNLAELKILWDENIIDNMTGKEIKIRGVYNMEIKNYIKTMDALNIKQAIFCGPPGTSKTYTAMEILKAQAVEVTGSTNIDLQDYKYKGEEAKQLKDKPIVWDMVQFHPSYCYEDFVRGISVKTNKEKEIEYKTVNKTLGRLAEIAIELGKDKSKEDKPKVFLVIDEINRANMATVFGELIYALEYRNKSISTPYSVSEPENKLESSDICIPDNLYIVGTMNTADKSIGGMDYAIRRRFLFFQLLPDKKLVEEQSGHKAVALFEKISKLFYEYLSPDFLKEDIQIGHTYFINLCNKNDIQENKKEEIKEETLKLRFKYQILPMLKEYYRDGVFDMKKIKSGIQDSEEDVESNLLRLISSNFVCKDNKQIEINIDNVCEKLFNLEDSEKESTTNL